MRPQYITNSRKHFFKTSDGVTNGVIVGDEFRRDVIREKHYVWKYRGYGLDACEAERLHASGIQWIVFIEKPDSVEYTVSMDVFLTNGIRDRLGGFELQIFMPLGAMSQTSPVNIQSKASSAGEVRFKKGTKTAKQLYLFGE